MKWKSKHKRGINNILRDYYDFVTVNKNCFDDKNYFITKAEWLEMWRSCSFLFVTI